ncbi:MAG: hypothetical protein ACLGI9_00825, partial [Thermoanaerobaculia bacterium]
QKQSKAIGHDSGTTVDIGDPAKSPDLSNELDNPDGTPNDEAFALAGTFQTIDVSAWYTGLGLGYQAPPVFPRNLVPWGSVLYSSGPRVSAPDLGDSRFPEELVETVFR